MKFHNTIEKLYDSYKNEIPLNLFNSDREKHIEWQNNYRLSIHKFSQIIFAISKINFLDEPISIDYDFDNLYPIFKILYNEKWIDFDDSGKILKFFPLIAYSDETRTRHLAKLKKLAWSSKLKKLTLEHFQYQLNEFCKKSTIKKLIYDTPNNKYNQFPCSIDSRLKRIDKIINDFPYIKDLTVSFIGDDDLVSIELAQKTNYKITVYEIDNILIEYLLKNKEVSPNLRIIQADIKEKNKFNEKYDVVLIDPPYNINGVCSFLECAKNILNDNGYIYLFINQMMLGNNALMQINKLITEMDFFIIEMIPTFSLYPFPKTYREYFDLDKEMQKINYFNVKDIYSSSSSLMVLKFHEIAKYSLNINLDRIYSRYIL